MKSIRYIILSLLLFSGLFGADIYYDQTITNDSWKPQAKIKLTDNGDDTYSMGTSARMAGVGGLQSLVYPFGEQNVATKYDDVSVQFQYNYLDNRFDVESNVTGTASVGVSDSVAYTLTNAPGEVAYISSIDSIRYRPGHSGYILFTLGADTNVTDSYVHGGGFNPDMSHGFAVEIKNNAMKFGFFKNGVKKGSDFADGFDSVDTTGIELSNMNIYLIMFGYLGVADPLLFVKNGGEWKLLHRVTTEGKSTETHTSTPVFPVTIMAHDGAKAYTGSWNGGVMGNGSSVGQRYFSFPNQILADGTSPEQGEMTLSGTDVSTIVVFNSKLTYQGKNNNIKARLTEFRFEIDIPPGTNIYGEVIFQLVAVEELNATATYADINTVSSALRYDHTPGVGASVSIVSGTPVLTEIVNYVSVKSGGNSGSVVIDAEKIGAYGYGGDTFAIIAKDLSGNNVTVRTTLYWSELF